MKILNTFFLIMIGQICLAQQSDEATIRLVFDQALANGKSYSMLDVLSNKVGHRLTGSPSAAAAVEWGKNEMKKLGFDSVWLQPVMVPHWVRGAKESGSFNTSRNGTTVINVCALGGSVGTGPKGVAAQVIEVKSIGELAQLGKVNIQGKIVFFNRPMDPSLVNTFQAYGGAIDQRVKGASEAAKFGAAAVLVRSMSPDASEIYPHTGTLVYEANVAQIPAFAVSTKHADMLSDYIKRDKGIQVNLKSSCTIMEDVPSFNVIGELKGTEFRNEFILVGGHLDSWDVGQGSHDDGAGCVQSIEVLRILKDMKYKPRHTIRVVLFMNEENGLRGGLKYAEQAAQKNEKHIVGIESDRGGFVPRGFSIMASDEVKKKIQSWKPLFTPYGLEDFSEEGAGADIGPLAAQGTPLMEIVPDSQRYFSYHHTQEDTFDKVNKRELELGAGSMAAMVYLIDKYGL
jgi:carboxypeptidase Q